ncbi:hypothetical protein LTR95_008194 [Oleoguttula sp. CCFEE 5521]
MAPFGIELPMEFQAALAATQASKDAASTSPAAIKKSSQAAASSLSSVAQDSSRPTASPFRGGMGASFFAHQPPSNAPTGPSRPYISKSMPRPQASGDNKRSANRPQSSGNINDPRMKPQSNGPNNGTYKKPQSSGPMNGPNKKPQTSGNIQESDETSEVNGKKTRRPYRGGRQVKEWQQNEQ